MFSGVKLRFYRQRAGKTQEALARELGVTSAYLSNIENGKRTPSHRIMEAIAQALAIRIKDLWEEGGNLPPIPISAEERGIVIEMGDGPGKLRYILPPTSETYLLISGQIAGRKGEADPKLRELVDLWERADERNRERMLALIKEGKE